MYLFNVTAHAAAHRHILIAEHTVDKKPVCIQSETFNHYIMWNIYQAFSESYDIKTYSSFFLYDDINIKFIPFKA